MIWKFSGNSSIEVATDNQVVVRRYSRNQVVYLFLKSFYFFYWDKVMGRITRYKNSFRVAFEGNDKNSIVNFFDVSYQWQYLFAHCDSNTSRSGIVGDLVCRFCEQDGLWYPDHCPCEEGDVLGCRLLEVCVGWCGGWVHLGQTLSWKSDSLVFRCFSFVWDGKFLCWARDQSLIFHLDLNQTRHR